VNAKIIFFAVAAAAAFGSAGLGGLIAAVIGLSIHLAVPALIAWAAGAAAGTFGAAVTLASIAAGLFFSAQEPPSSSDPSHPAAKSH